jgi:hypothetical protein
MEKKLTQTLQEICQGWERDSVRLMFQDEARLWTYQRCAPLLGTQAYTATVPGHAHTRVHHAYAAIEPITEDHSMGRLMLNVLLSFAQFEREVTGERIRNKIAASKRKGMWMGGIPPIGYDVANRRLIPNEDEAKTIAHIFQRFVELGSTTKLVKELRLDGVTSKAWTTQDGRVREGKPIDKGLIYKVLNNRTYLGELRHKELWYQAEHPPIITKSIWDDAHAILSTNGRVRAGTTRAATQYLLKGIVFGSDGRAMSPFQTAKQNGRRYRYYVPQRDIKEHAGASGLPRMPAAELESAVLEQLRGHLRSPDVGNCDQSFVKAFLICATFVPGHKQDRISLRIKCKGHTPDLALPRKTQFLHVGVSGAVQRIHSWSPKIWAEFNQQFRVSQHLILQTFVQIIELSIEVIMENYGPSH